MTAAVSLDRLWTEMETEASSDMPGILRRRIHPAAALPIYVLLTVPERERSIAIEVPQGVRIGGLPERTKAVDSRMVATSTGRRLQGVLLERELNGLFSVMAEDVTGQAAASPDAESAVDAWITRMRLWQRMLQRVGRGGLSAEQQRGLYAELHLLREHLIPMLGPVMAVAGWTGPEAAAHDFQFPRGAIEVKATVTSPNQEIMISSERQLDTRATPLLVLYVLSLEVRRQGGETLAQAVAAARELVRDTAATGELNDRLLCAGWLDDHADRYSQQAYTVREHNFLEVTADFPRITEKDLRPGVGHVTYAISVPVAKRWRLSDDDALARLSKAIP